MVNDINIVVGSAMFDCWRLALSFQLGIKVELGYPNFGEFPHSRSPEASYFYGRLYINGVIIPQIRAIAATTDFHLLTGKRP